MLKILTAIAIFIASPVYAQVCSTPEQYAEAAKEVKAEGPLVLEGLALSQFLDAYAKLHLLSSDDLVKMDRLEFWKSAEFNGNVLFVGYLNGCSVAAGPISPQEIEGILTQIKDMQANG